MSCEVGFRTVEIRDRRLLVNGEPVLIAGVNRHEHDDTHGPRCLARVDGDGRPADEALQRQRRAHLALPERSVLARALRPLRPLRRRRGEHRVARVLRRAVPRPGVPQRSGSSASRTWSSATRTTRASSSGRSATRAATARTTTRPRAGCARATRRGRCTTRARSRATGRRRACCHGRRLPDVRRRRVGGALGADGHRRPAPADPLRVLARDGQLERRPVGLLGRVPRPRRAAGRVHLGVGRPRDPANRPERA